MFPQSCFIFRIQRFEDRESGAYETAHHEAAHYEPSHIMHLCGLLVQQFSVELLVLRIAFILEGFPCSGFNQEVTEVITLSEKLRKNM